MSKGEAWSVSQLLAYVDVHEIDLVVVIDLYAISNSGIAAPWRAFKLRRGLRSRGVTVNTFIWDALDPSMLLISNLLVGANGKSFILANVNEEAEKLGYINPVGPVQQFFFSPVLERVPDMNDDFSSRIYDLYIPPDDHPKRTSLTTLIRRESESLGLSLAPARTGDYTRYLCILQQTRISIVVNSIRTSYTKLLPKRLLNDAPWTHAVGRNFESVAAGCLLVAEKTTALREYFEPGVHFLEWNRPDEAWQHVLWARSNPGEVEIMAKAARKRLGELAQERQLRLDYLNCQFR
jgi:hypothetical protein